MTREIYRDESNSFRNEVREHVLKLKSIIKMNLVMVCLEIVVRCRTPVKCDASGSCQVRGNSMVRVLNSTLKKAIIK